MEWAHLMFLVVLVVSMLHSCADAQAGTASNPPMGITLRDNLKATMSVMLVALLSAFLFMGFFSLYLRHCSYGHGAANRNPIASAADLCRRGFNRQVIDKCPVLAYSVVKDLKIGKGSLECAVCLSEFQDYDNIRLLPKCHHVFHLDCIDAWLLSHMNCPVCRARLTPDVADDIAIPITALASPSNNEHGPTTAPEQWGHEMEHNNLEEGQSSTVTGSGVAVTAEADTDSTALAAQNLIIPPREWRMLDRFPRSHSTGHSLAEPEENIKVVDRYTLRLPERVREHIVANHGWVRRLPTSDVVLPGEWSSKTACYRGNYENVERWSLSLTPPSASLSYYGWGDDIVHNDNLRSETTCWTPLRMPFYRAQGPQKPSPIPPV